MKRSTGNYNGIPYLRYDPIGTPQGTILFLHGQGEKGNDIKDGTTSIIERNEIPKLCITAGFEVPYIVIAPQLASNQGGWYANTTGPIIQMCVNLGLPVHLTGLSLGSMVGPTLIADNPGVFSSLATCCGKMEVSDPTKLLTLYKELLRIPSVHYYDPTDQTIAYGYLSIKSMCDIMKSRGADCTLFNLSGGHSIWSQAYNLTHYWAWLQTKISPISETTGPGIWDGTTLNFTTSSGKILKIKPDATA